MHTKKCSGKYGCGKVKDIEEFHNVKGDKIRIFANCRECRAIQSKIWRQNNPTQVKKYNNSEERKEYMKNYEKNDPLYFQKYYNKNSCILKEYAKNWKILNRIRVNEYHHKRETLKANLPYSITIIEYKDTLEYFNYSCANCGSKRKLHQDHFIALDDPDCPGNTKFNLIPLCEHCNCSKSNKRPEDFFDKKIFQYIIRYLMSYI